MKNKVKLINKGNTLRIQYRRYISSRYKLSTFSKYSEANASKYLENVENLYFSTSLVKKVPQTFNYSGIYRECFECVVMTIRNRA